MTQVRESWEGHSGLFALQDFEKGDSILTELEPLIKLAPSSAEESHQLYCRWVGLPVSDDSETKSVPKGNNGRNNNNKVNTTTKRETLWDSIVVPSDIDDSYHGIFKGMVQAGVTWMVTTGDGDSTRSDDDKILQLYYPTDNNRFDDNSADSDPENVVRQLSKQAVEYLKTSSTKSSGEWSKFQDWGMLEKILRIWACNSFQGGLLYDTFSRVNHSCNPNAVIVTNSDDDKNTGGQRLVAATKIQNGEEIFISYLGLFLYADTTTRRKKLKQTKYFECQCQRCTSSHDPAAQTPCPTCHPRDTTQLSLDEDVQYDDEGDVQYVSSRTEPCSNCLSTPQQLENQRLDKVLISVNEKIYAFIDTYQGSTKDFSNGDNATESNEEDVAVLEEHVSLASTMMGAKHWTTSVMLLLHLNNQLSSMSQRMLTTQELPEMEDVAEAIDTLQRLYQFVDSLQLHLDAGHILGDVTIGVARTLVSLGDEKSQKYGAEWLSKIEDYVAHFGGEGRQKVVAALKGAWKKHGRSNGLLDEDGRSEAKKPKAVDRGDRENGDASSVAKVRDEHFMRHALHVAEQALRIGEVPVGCVIVLTDHPLINRAKAEAGGAANSNGDDLMDNHVVVSHGANQVNATRDATRHAEIVAIDRLLTNGQSSDQLRLPANVDSRNGNNSLGIPESIQAAREKQWEDVWINRPDCPTHWKNLFGWRSNQFAEELRSPGIFSSCELFVTCEPCIMCASALATVGIKRVVFGCKNDRFGGCGSLLHLHQPEQAENGNQVEPNNAFLSPGYAITSGVLEAEAIKLLQSFYDRENFHAPDDKRKEKEKKYC
ncbi:CMP/dCMP deaminase zinc-binding protein [Nitzschia inconspicua]|uniref:CMP/dCMP deaminase zinc-binding protein n=1 Tax=Nitzschia inconspicua TaxID=303405 RepID=A0A9K3LA20_9STRA|nr:CMP/dCMP deaminase zinc-binding protein [Nitzschia inconspicua]